jgi:RNA polymerase sigma-54 factor
MKLSMSLQTSLLQTLTPQQIQYLKLLQLPILQLEQHVRQEIEQNPMLDELNDEVHIPDDDEPYAGHAQDVPAESAIYQGMEDEGGENGGFEERDEFQDHHDPFDFYESAWHDNLPSENPRDDDEDDDGSGFQIKDQISFADELLVQLGMLEMTDEMRLVCTYIIGNLEDDGYLRRPLDEIVQDINQRIQDENQKRHREYLKKQKEALIRSLQRKSPNPAYSYALSGDFASLDDDDEPADQAAEDVLLPPEPVPPVHIALAEQALQIVQHLDPPGIAARDLRECLLLQLYARTEKSAAEDLAQLVLEKSYDAFIMKHYPVICRQLGLLEDQLRMAIDAIRRLNPKPGGGANTVATSSVIPDFQILADEESNDLIINVNDSRIPQLRLNKMYEELKKEARYRKYNKETKEWLRKKYDDAKFLLQAIRQRKKTMLKVMTGIAGAQKDFFLYGESALKPLIYKDVADVTGMDVSTICRIVNGKYVQTAFGTFELRFFFSESLPSDDGEEISTRVIKQKIRDLIDKEPKGKPFSDDKLTKELKKQGLNVARRTVAKYREQLRIPVARLRKEL